MLKTKNTIIAAIVLLLIGAGVFWFMQRNNISNTGPERLDLSSPEYSPENPGFLVGTIIEPPTESHVLFMSNGKRYVARILFSTQMLKQQKRSGSSTTIAPANLLEFKEGTVASFHYTEMNEDGTFDANRIQIISQ